MPFEFRASAIVGVLLVQPRSFLDGRGWFSETFKASEFAAAGIEDPFVQENLSWSERRGTLRGLHFQRPPLAQGKLVHCLRGTIFDVVVDLRRGSPTEGRILTFEVSSTTREMIWVPPGLAHGFQTLTDDCLVEYKTTSEYSPVHEGGIRWDDRELEIPWPIVPPIVSPRDAELPFAADRATDFFWEAP